MKKIISVIVACMLATQLSGCAVEPVQVNMSNNGNVSSETLGELVVIGGLLSYDPATRIVYRLNKNSYGSTYIPYYAPNGLPYRYNPETNTFEEIVHDGA